ncbi:MAG: hypothetical protein FWE38_01010 [Firmicutes bacterium]|nr:hypothetical protein [Bacillota bacterium]
MQQKYQDIIAAVTPELERVSKRDNVVGWVKFFMVLGLLALFYMFLSSYLWYLAIFGAAVIAFVVVIVVHQGIRRRVNYYQTVINICKKHIDRVEGRWSRFTDTGAEFKNPEHPYSADLDIVGPVSLFQFLNTTDSWHGRVAFARDLLESEYDNVELLRRQEAVVELGQDVRESVDMQYYFSKIGVNREIYQIVKELQTDNKPFPKLGRVTQFILTWIPFLTLPTLVANFVWQPPGFLVIFGLIMFAKLGIWGYSTAKTREYFGGLNGMAFSLGAYANAVTELVGRTYTSEKLNEIKSKLVTAERGLAQLDGVSSMIRGGGFVMNILLLWNFRCAFALGRWKEKYKTQVADWFRTMGEFESLLALSNLAHICGNTTMPKFAAGEGILDTVEMGHPLIPNDKRVNNDFQMNNEIKIISGSNMSGKTTFLRTIGVNIVLARAGAHVCAKEFTLTPFNVMTSMRIADDLNSGVSTFYAELKRIKGIIDFSSGPRPLFLIDEIFRGTNSVDRLDGARSVIAELEKLGASGLVSTHDLELCDLAKLNKRIHNRHFSEYYRDNKIHFDYKLKDGVSKTTNAKHLMELIGIK